MLGAVARGSLGFAAVSVAGFAVWAFGGRWFYRHGGEVALYAACALVFAGTAGGVLHPLVRGPNRLRRFYQVFVPAFLAYAIAWSAAWFGFGFGAGEWLGSLAGCAAFAAVACGLLGQWRRWPPVGGVLFVAHSAGYFLGGQLYAGLRAPAAAEALGGLSEETLATLGRLGWGLLYGLGFGAGLGYAFFALQEPTTHGRPPVRASGGQP